MKKVNVSQALPKSQKEIIRKALELQYKAIDSNVMQGDNIEYMKHDLRTLIAFLDYDISVTLSKDMIDKFSFLHGVDFPEYTEVDAKYPIETKSVDEWVTVMTGDFSFIDDGIHQREAHVNNLVGIQRHLRSQVEDVISDLDDGGHGWLVVEDYDGAIITDTKKEPVEEKRNFQVVWMATHYNPKSELAAIDHFSDDNGYEIEDQEQIDALDVSDQYTTQQGGVVVIRIT
tara:strand:- start:6803 stop:7492 length:690 start_codon:yes stop_codon:yes gene_type:complete